MNITAWSQDADASWGQLLHLARWIDGSDPAEFLARLNALSPAVGMVDVEGMEIGLDPVSPATQVAALRLLCHDLRALAASLASLRDQRADPDWGTASASIASAG